MSNTITTIYWQSESGQTRIAGKVSFARLVHVCPLASERLRGTSGKQLLLKESDIDYYALKWILDWVEKYNIKKSAVGQEMRTSAIHSPLSNPSDPNPHIDISDVVKIQAASYYLRINPFIKGDDLKNAVYSYIKEKPLTADDFLMILEWLPFHKKDLIKTAIHQCAHQKVFGPRPEDIEKIEEIAGQFGYLEEMKALEAGFVKTKERQDANKAFHEQRLARQAKREADQAERAAAKAEWKKKTATEGYAAAAKGGNGKKSGQ